MDLEFGICILLRIFEVSVKLPRDWEQNPGRREKWLPTTKQNGGSQGWTVRTHAERGAYPCKPALSFKNLRAEPNQPPLFSTPECLELQASREQRESTWFDTDQGSRCTLLMNSEACDNNTKPREVLAPAVLRRIPLKFCQCRFSLVRELGI